LGRTFASDDALDVLLSERGQALDSDCVEALVGALRPRQGAIPLSQI
jgi:hypothetical protein